VPVSDCDESIGQREIEAMIQWRCAGCNKLLKTDDTAAGKKVRCPGCGEILIVRDMVAPLDMAVEQPMAKPASKPVAGAPGSAAVPLGSVPGGGLPRRPPPAYLGRRADRGYHADEESGLAGKKKKLITIGSLVLLANAWWYGFLGLLFGVGLPLASAALIAVGIWKVFTKAGQPGWAALVPFYNLVVLMKIAGKPAWWFMLCCIPVVNLIASIPVAKKFGKDTKFAVGLALLPMVFYPILGLGRATYQGS